jgi:glycosyltransferase involved in cell wall biosynthesis
MELSAAAPATLPPPRESVRAVVVVPAHDEEERIGRCLEALTSQVEVGPDEFEVIVVLDACSDATATRVSDFIWQKLDKK